MQIEISNGEIVDRFTILMIKSKRITDLDKLGFIVSDISGLLRAIGAIITEFPEMKPVIDELQRVNETLWDVEDALREKEQKKEFDDKFIELARSVYINNDKRAQIKDRINVVTGTPGEVKQYTEYSK